MLFDRAVQTLRQNDRGAYTVPTAGLYPYQWNWDSVFTALGFARFDIDRAWTEIETLFEAQWPDGMVPHIVFRVDEDSYFPGPDVWQANHGPVPSSGISQPPVAATVAHKMAASAPDRARAMIPKLDAWHRWFHAARDPHDLGVIAITHPWESGRDNLPSWDRPGDAIDTNQVGEYERRDTALVHPQMRPKKKDYDRYVALVQFGREQHWDSATVAANSPFLVADVGITAILLRAERDLLSLIETYGGIDQAPVRDRIARMEAGFELLWNPEVTAYCPIDLRTDERAGAASSASFLAWYAGIDTHTDEMLAELERFCAATQFSVPSFDPRNVLFDPVLYWRGPVWAMMNYMIATGLADFGHSNWFNRIRTDTMTLIEQSGFAEYFNPTNGQPCGGDAFSWTAAIWLAWAE